jgi:hypothetical protein
LASNIFFRGTGDIRGGNRAPNLGNGPFSEDLPEMSMLRGLCERGGIAWIKKGLHFHEEHVAGTVHQHIVYAIAGNAKQ